MSYDVKCVEYCNERIYQGLNFGLNSCSTPLWMLVIIKPYDLSLNFANSLHIMLRVKGSTEWRLYSKWLHHSFLLGLVQYHSLERQYYHPLKTSWPSPITIKENLFTIHFSTTKPLKTYDIPNLYRNLWRMSTPGPISRILPLP